MLLCTPLLVVRQQAGHPAVRGVAEAGGHELQDHGRRQATGGRRGPGLFPRGQQSLLVRNQIGCHQMLRHRPHQEGQSKEGKEVFADFG